MNLNVLPFIAAFVGLFLWIYMAIWFSYSAEDKGHPRTFYLVVCLLLPLIGYIMVAALPDLVARSIISKANQTPKATNGEWVCSCGRTNPNYVTTCPCGINKRDIN